MQSDDAEGDDDSVQTSDNSDNRTAAEIAQNFFDIAQASKHEIRHLLEFAKQLQSKHWFC